MDLCDEADTANDGKISIEEYLTIAKNYGIKVVPIQNTKYKIQPEHPQKKPSIHVLMKPSSCSILH